VTKRMAPSNKIERSDWLVRDFMSDYLAIAEMLSYRLRLYVRAGQPSSRYFVSASL
jgi:hypothetical protein